MDREATATDLAPDGATLIDFQTEARRVRVRSPRREATPDELVEAFAASVRRTLLADLATWPEAFRRAVEPTLLDMEFPDVRFYAAANLWTRFRDARRLDDADEGPSALSGCGCGCRGFNGEVARKIRRLRLAAQERNLAPSPLRYGWRHIETAKADLLECMWYYGRRRIDRARLRQHIAESARAEIETLTKGDGWSSLPRLRERLAETERRLREGVYLKGPRKGQPIDEQKRAEYVERIRGLRGEIAGKRARPAALRAELADEAALVRKWTGCERGVPLDAGEVA